LVEFPIENWFRAMFDRIQHQTERLETLAITHLGVDLFAHFAANLAGISAE
jgi:hypothetical protein